MQQWRRRERHRQKIIITIRDLSNNRVFLIDPLNLLSVGDFSRVEFIKKIAFRLKKTKENSSLSVYVFQKPSP